MAVSLPLEWPKHGRKFGKLGIFDLEANFFHIFLKEYVEDLVFSRPNATLFDLSKSLLSRELALRAQSFAQ